MRRSERLDLDVVAVIMLRQRRWWKSGVSEIEQVQEILRRAGLAFFNRKRGYKIPPHQRRRAAEIVRVTAAEEVKLAERAMWARRGEKGNE